MTKKAFHLIYIHGFNSSPLSHKATQLRLWLDKQHPKLHTDIPALNPFPLQAITQLEQMIAKKSRKVGLIGSSLGGFYAAYLAEKFDVPVVLINPAVRPFDTLSRYLGENQNCHSNESYTLEQQHVDDLRSLFIEKHKHPQQLFLMVQTGDETLDYREATTHYWRSKSIIEYGGDHSFQRIERFFPAMLNFLQQY